MKSDIRERWVTALRSGDYEQGKDFLRSGSDKFCCLGVLCDILDGVSWEFDEDHNAYRAIYKGQSSLVVLPYVHTGQEIDLSVCLEGNLTLMNDDGATFEEIADFIESDPQFDE